ncbi:hypothetical protein BDV59DRAFT_187607 [Aspergillus ambiguus]|uniref:uncharacterized protein n=1 Tax=Aspergillus ambiguus TaxID=176160 RepID=UPI003CCDFD9C
MNRFLKSKKDKLRDEGESTDSFHSALTAKLSKRSKKEPEETPELDLSTALPSTDDFRTSLLMPKLSARFSMLREQDDPDSMMGKASDDSVLFPKRASRLNLFGHTPNFLADIDEVSTDGSRPSFNLARADSFASGVDGYGTDDDRSQKDSIMSRARRAEGNNLFGGRQKVYKIPVKAAAQTEAGRSGMGGRAVYEPDVTLSAFQRYRLQEKERVSGSGEDTQQESHVPESEDGLSSISSTKRTTFSSTASGPVPTGRTSTAATSIDEQSFANTSGVAADAAHPGPKPPLSGMAPDRGSVKSRRLYGQGLAQSVQNQHNSALHRLESLSRQRTGTPELPLLNRSYSKSATNLRERLQKLAIAEPPAGQTSRPSSPPSSAASPTPQPVETEPKERKPQTSPAYAAPPLSPPHSENDETAALVAALQPEDHGKATAMGLFNKPRTAFDEEQFTRRQLQMHQGRNTPPLSRPSPTTSGRATPQDFTGRPRGPSTTSYRSRGGSVSSHYSETQRPGTGTSASASSARPVHGTFFDTTPSESEDEGDYAAVHPALRSKTPSKPSTPTEEEPSPLSPLPEVRYSDLGDLKPIAEQDIVEPPPNNHEEAVPEKPDSPTLGPSGLGLSGLVRTHLRSGSDRSSMFPPPSPGLPPNPVNGDDDRHPPAVESEEKATVAPQSTMPSFVDPQQALNGSSWQGQIVAQHRRGGSTETQKEREEFESELAERRRKVQEKLKGFAETESRSASPVSGRQTPDYPPPRPGNAFSLLKSRSGKHPLFNKQPDPANRGYGAGNASTPTLATEDSWEERPPFIGKQSNSSSPHIVGDRSVRSKIAAFNRVNQGGSRESSRSRGASPHSSFRSRRERSSSDASGRSKSRNRRDREDLATLREDTVGTYGQHGYPEIDTHGMNSVASSTRPSVEVGDSPYDRSSSVASGQYRSRSQSGTHDRLLQPAPTMNSPMVGAAAPRPSPIAPYSANATPPLYDLPADQGILPATTYQPNPPQRAPGHPALQKRIIDKSKISEPTFVSSTSNVPTVGLPPGASLSNGMETPPVPPMNPRRRRQTTTQTILGAIKGDKPDTPPNDTWEPDEHSTFSDEGERRPKSRHRLRKTSSEGGNLNAKARQQAMGATPPAMPSYPPPQVPMDGGMF